MNYGTNYTHFSPPTGNTGQQGVICTYHLNRALAQQQLGQMRANGLTAIRIPMEINAAEELGGLEDGWNLKLTTDSWLVPQEQTNLQNLLADIKAYGFSYVEVGPGASGYVLSPYNWKNLNGQWFRMAKFFEQMRPIIQSYGFPEWSYDLCGEWIDPNNDVVMAYAKTIWTWYTTEFWLGKRCEDATISFTPEPQNIKAVLDVFRGLDPTGPVNWPKQLQIHIYGESEGSVFGSAHEALEYALDGLPMDAHDNCEIAIGEMYDVRDKTSLAEIQRAVKDNPSWKWKHMIQWPEMRPGVNTSPALEGVEG